VRECVLVQAGCGRGGGRGTAELVLSVEPTWDGGGGRVQSHDAEIMT